jgi:hypothetical protein
LRPLCPTAAHAHRKKFNTTLETLIRCNLFMRLS